MTDEIKKRLAAEWMTVEGSGGKSGSSFTEDPNSLKSVGIARILDLISEGEIGGLVNGAKSIFLDDTPVQNSDDTLNFQGVTWAAVYGLPDQAHIPGLTNIEAPFAGFTTISLLAGVANVRRITDVNVDAVRLTIQVPALNIATDTALKGTSVSLNVRIKSEADQPDAAWRNATSITITGKTTSPYEEDHRIELVGNGPWDIEVTRTTADSTDVKLVNETKWSRLQLIYDHKFSYPYSALIGLEVNSQYFGTSIPRRAYEIYGLIIRVPENYDPVARTYTGTWNGTFKWAWTNNPAWVFYDLVTNERYGLGIPSTYVDKWSLYTIGQYCDGIGARGEASRTNLIANSGNLSVSPWSVSNGTRSLVSGTDINGSAIYKYAANSTSTTGHSINYTLPTASVASGSTVTVSATVKAVGYNAFVFNVTSKQAVTTSLVVDLVNGTVASASNGTSGTITREGVDRWRVTYTFPAGTGTSDIICRMRTFATTATGAYSGDGVSGYEVSSPQIEIGSKATAYIPTSGTAVTVAATDDYHPVTGRHGVPDGFGGIEPRFTFNGVLNQGEQAYKVLQALASAFRGMVYWSAGLVTAAQDRPGDPVKLFSPANVINGDFEYMGSSKKARHTVAVVGWNNPDTGYEMDYEVVEDRSGIVRYGMKPTDMTAVGCTSRGQARRMGRWTLATEALETDSVKFKTGFDGVDLVPGDLILIADPAYAGVRMGGRITAFTTTTIQIDAVFTFKSGEVYQINIISEDGRVVDCAVANAPGTSNVVQLVAALATEDLPLLGAIYVISEVGNVEPRPFRVISVAEADQHQFEIFAIEHQPIKYTIADEAASFDTDVKNKYQDLPNPSYVSPPSDLFLQVNAVDAGFGVVPTLFVDWTPSTDILVDGYLVSYRVENDNWVTLPTTKASSAEISNVVTGRYDLRVMAVNRFGVPSAVLTKSIDVSSFSDAASKNLIENLRGDRNDGTFTGTDVQLYWDAKPLSAPAKDASASFKDQFFDGFRVRIYAGATLKRTEYVYDAYYLYDIDKNNADGTGRAVTAKVSMRSKDGTFSNEVSLTLTNPAPVAPTVTITTQPGVAYLKFVEPIDPDYAGIAVYASITTGFTPNDTTNRVWQGLGQPVLKFPAGSTQFLRWVFYDAFGKTGLTIEAQVSTAIPYVVEGDLDPALAIDVVAASEAADDAIAAANTAATNAINAAASANTATTQAANAVISAGNASTSASNALTQATNSATSASNAATSAATATTQASNATTAAANAVISQGSASTSASNAATSATSAATSASNANTSASNAGTSATAAAGSASNAATSATAAGNSATSALASAVRASSRAYRNLVSKGIFSDGTVGEWTGTVSSVTPSVAAPDGSSKVLRSQARDAYEGNVNAPFAGAWGNRILKISGYAMAPGNHPCHVGVMLWKLGNSSNKLWPVVLAANAGTTTWQAFSAEITLHAEATHIIPFVQSLNTTTPVLHDVMVTNLLIEDITDSKSATDAATAAAGSATSAATSSTNAGNFASAASTSATNAATSAGNASTSATNASNSATTAAGHASTASTQASNAATSALNAGNSATAAGTSATNAATSATNAGNSATAANTSAVNAASSYTGALNLASSLLPYDFTQDGVFWTAANSGQFPVALAGWTFTTVSGVGRVATRSSNDDIYSRGYFKPVAGRSYTIRARFRYTVDSTSGFSQVGRVFFAGFNDSFTYLDRVGATLETNVAAGWQELSFTASGDTLIALGSGATTNVRAMFRAGGLGSNTSNGTVELAYLLVKDTTEADSAANSATAAASSASAANTSATNAGTFASAASTSATNAATSASNASTSASNASTSATNASNSASTASTQAANAATSATAAANSALSAGNSATAAAGSATTASTQATNAGNSATSAAASAVTATSSANLATLTAAALFPATLDSTASQFTTATSGSPSAAALPSSGSIVNLAGYGFVFQIGSGVIFYNRGVAPATAARVYEVEVEFQVSVYGGTAIVPRVGVRGLDSTYTNLGAADTAMTSQTATGINTFRYRFSSAAGTNIAAWQAGSVWVRPYVRFTGGSVGDVIYIRKLTMTDVTSVVAAENQVLAAQRQIQPLFPDRLDSTSTNFTLTGTGDVATGASASAGVVTESGYGFVYNLAASTNLFAKGHAPATNGKVYEVEAEYSVTVYGGAAITPVLAMQGNTSTYTNQGTASVNMTNITSTGVFVMTRRFSNVAPSGGTAWTASSVWLRPGARFTGGAGSTVYLRRLTMKDITAVVSAESQASAAATSASAASTSATNAGTSATAAATSATNASTSAGNASTFATNASNSATNALGSANTATTQAGNAATSATNAANSANAANTSASNASTFATNAGNSATAANTSATNAASSYNSAVQRVASTLPSDFSSNEFWTNDGFKYLATSAAISSSNIRAVSGIGDVYFTNTSITYLATRGVISPTVNSRYRMNARVRVITGTFSGTLQWNRISTDGTNAGTPSGTAGPTGSPGFTSITSANGWVSLESEYVFTATDVTNGVTALKPSVRITTFGTEIEIQYLQVKDVTGEVNATTSATAAATSATNASTSASDAATSATAASNSSISAASSLASANTVASILFPDRLDSTSSMFTLTATGSANSGASASGGVVTESGYGSVYNLTAGTYLYAKGVAPAAASRTYEIEAEYSVTVYGGAAITPLLAMVGLNSSFSSLGTAPDTLTNITATGVYTYRERFAASAGTNILAWTASSVWLRPGAQFTGGAGSTVYLRRLTVRDVTALVSAEAQATSATNSASAALTSASAAATSATNAGNSATTAQNSANTATTEAGNASSSASSATTSANNASSSATNAANSATSASGSANTATTQAGNAATSASSASTSAATATTQAAAASASASLAASIGVRALVKNPSFADFPTATGVPTGWVNWSNGSGTRVTGEIGTYAYDRAGGAGSNAGISQDGQAGSVVQNAWFVIEAHVKLIAGAFTGSGVLFKVLNNAGSSLQDLTLNFATDKDSTGAVIGAGTTGKIYRFAKLVRATNASSDKFTLYALTHWGTLGSTAAANQITWYSCLVRPATDQEIATQQAVTDLAAQSVTVSTQSTAIATLQQVYGSYGIQVNANGNIAGLYLYSGSGIATSSGVRIEADQFLIRAGTATAVTPFTYDAVAGKLSLNGVSANEIEATATIKIGVGDNTVILDGKTSSDKRIAVGNSIADAAPFWVSKTGKMKATDWELYDANGALMLSKNGPTDAFKLSILASASNTLPTTTTIVGSVTNLANTTTVLAANKVAARLGDNSTVSVGVSWNLSAAYGANETAFPSSVTLDVQQRYSTDGVTWGAWSSIGSQAFTKITSGSPTSTQYRVKQTTTTYKEYDSELDTFITYNEVSAVVDAGNPATFTITATAQNAGYYEYAVVGGNASPFVGCPTTLTLTDTDGIPSFIIGTIASSGSVGYSNPVGTYKRLRIESTGDLTATVTANFVIVSTPEGLTRTIANLNTSINLGLSSGSLGRLDTGTLAANTWYYIWAVSSGSADGVVVSASSTAPSLTGYRYTALIGVIRTNNGTPSVKIKPFKQRGAQWTYVFVSGTELDMVSGNVGNVTTPIWVSVDLLPFCPYSLTIEVLIGVQASNGTVIVAPNNTYGGSGNTTNRPPVVFQTAGADLSTQVRLAPEGVSAWWASTHATGKLVAQGFILDI